MRNRKIIVIGMALVMIASSFTACGKDNKSEDDPATTTTITDVMVNGDDSTTFVNEEITVTTETKDSSSTTTTKKSNQNPTTTKKNETPTKAPTTTKKPETTTKAPTTTQPQVHYLTYAEVKECVAEAERYAISRGFKINKSYTTANSGYRAGSDTRMLFTKADYTGRLKYYVDDCYNMTLESFGYFYEDSEINIFIEGPDELPRWSSITTNPDGTPRYVAYVCA